MLSTFSTTVCLLALLPARHHDENEAIPTHDARAVTDCVALGEGAWSFESVAGWARFPEGEVLGPTHGGVAIDKQGRIFVATDGERGIAIFGADGKLTGMIAKDFAGCHSLMLREEDGQEFLYAAHLAGHQVLKLDLEGHAQWIIPCPMESGAYKKIDDYHPTSVALAPDGSIFVADGYGTSLIHKFDRERKWVKSFAGAGSEDGKCSTCHGLAIDTRGEKPLLLVCDRANRRLVHFDFDGKFVDTIATKLRLPCAVAFQGKCLAIAELEGRVTILDEHNAQVAHLGDNQNEPERANYNVPPADWKEGVFTAPHGLCFDREGNLFVQDWNATGRISKLRRLAADAAPAKAR